MTDQRPTSIPGYEHPEELVYNSNKVYKTFTEGKKSSTFGTAKVGNLYASNAEFETEEEVLCPQCNEPPVSVCPCGYNDKKCKNAHVWYTDRDDTINTTNPQK